MCVEENRLLQKTSHITPGRVCLLNSDNNMANGKKEDFLCTSHATFGTFSQRLVTVSCVVQDMVKVRWSLPSSLFSTVGGWVCFVPHHSTVVVFFLFLCLFYASAFIPEGNPRDFDEHGYFEFDFIDMIELYTI